MNGGRINAGFAIRLAAYLIDVLPITVGTAALFYFFAGFDQTLHAYLNRQPDDLVARAKFLQERNLIRDLAFLVYVLYGSLMEGSALQGTVGKRLTGLQVTDISNLPMSFKQAFGRNAAKILSYIPFCLGFLWILFTKKNLAWHDKLSGTVVRRR